MTLPTAEWCRERADMFRSDFEWPRTEAALRIAARVLDERTEDRIHDSVLLVTNGDISEREAVSAILAYLKGEAS